MNIVIIGANGGVGRHLVELALIAGHHVTAACRDPDALNMAHWNLRTVACDVRDPQSVHAAVIGQDVVFSALGDSRRGPTDLYSTGAVNILGAMRDNHVPRLVFLSNFGAMGERGSDISTALLLMMIRKVIPHTLSDHARAIAAIRAQAPEWVAVRPMAMNRGPHTGKYRVALEGLPRWGAQISRADVADFMLKQASGSQFLGKVPALAY